VIDFVIMCKWVIVGVVVKGDVLLRVVLVEVLGNILLFFDIIIGIGDFIVNGVVSYNCFVCFIYIYFDFNVWEDFEREIVVKVNVFEFVCAELVCCFWKGDYVVLGINIDLY